MAIRKKRSRQTAHIYTTPNQITQHERNLENTKNHVDDVIIVKLKSTACSTQNSQRPIDVIAMDNRSCSEPLYLGYNDTFCCTDNYRQADDGLFSIKNIKLSSEATVNDVSNLSNDLDASGVQCFSPKFYDSADAISNTYLNCINIMKTMLIEKTYNSGYIGIAFFPARLNRMIRDNDIANIIPFKVLPCSFIPKENAFWKTLVQASPQYDIESWIVDREIEAQLASCCFYGSGAKTGANWKNILSLFTYDNKLAEKLLGTIFSIDDQQETERLLHGYQHRRYEQWIESALFSIYSREILVSDPTNDGIREKLSFIPGNGATYALAAEINKSTTKTLDKAGIPGDTNHIHELLEYAKNAEITSSDEQALARRYTLANLLRVIAEHVIAPTASRAAQYKTTEFRDVNPGSENAPTKLAAQLDDIGARDIITALLLGVPYSDVMD